jgi:hypothetical protein
MMQGLPTAGPPGRSRFVVDADKFATLTAEGMLNYVTEGLPMEERLLALATQGQSYGPHVRREVDGCCVEDEAQWALISTQDQMLPPAMEATMAKRMGAVTCQWRVATWSFSRLPVEVAAIIDQAARNALNNHPNE